MATASLGPPSGFHPRRPRLFRLGLAAGVATVWLFFSELALPHGQDFTMMCADNSGAWDLKIIGRVGRSMNEGGTPTGKGRVKPGDMIVVVGRTGLTKNRVMKAVVVRTRMRTPDPSKNGFWYTYDTNAAVVIDPDGNPVGSKIIGPIDPRCARRWPKIALIARNTRS